LQKEKKSKKEITAHKVVILPATRKHIIMLTRIFRLSYIKQQNSSILWTTGLETLV